MTKPCVPQPLTPVAQTSFCIFTPFSIGQAPEEQLLWLLIPSQFSDTHSLPFPLSPPSPFSFSHTHKHTTSSRCIQNCRDPVSVAHPGGLPQHPWTKFQHTPTPFSDPASPFPVLLPLAGRPGKRGEGGQRRWMLLSPPARRPLAPAPVALPAPFTLRALYLPTGS